MYLARVPKTKQKNFRFTIFFFLVIPSYLQISTYFGKCNRTLSDLVQAVMKKEVGWDFSEVGGVLLTFVHVFFFLFLSIILHVYLRCVSKDHCAGLSVAFWLNVVFLWYTLSGPGQISGLRRRNFSDVCFSRVSFF